MKHPNKSFVVMIPMVFLAACATSGEKTATLDTTPATNDMVKAAKVPTTEIPSTPTQARIENDPKKETTGPLAKRVIYFSFDKSNINSTYARIIQEHGAYLANHPNVHIRLEGYTDERGTREYNMALGERRDNSVEELLSQEGVAKDQMKAISYGEQNPVATGHDESSWRLNRRVEIVYF